MSFARNIPPIDVALEPIYTLPDAITPPSGNDVIAVGQGGRPLAKSTVLALLSGQQIVGALILNSSAVNLTVNGGTLSVVQLNNATANQPPPGDSSNAVPTTAWVLQQIIASGLAAVQVDGASVVGDGTTANPLQVAIVDAGTY